MPVSDPLGLMADAVPRAAAADTLVESAKTAPRTTGGALSTVLIGLLTTGALMAVLGV
jgi:hypothetical protein